MRPPKRSQASDIGTSITRSQPSSVSSSATSDAFKRAVRLPVRAARDTNVTAAVSLGARNGTAMILRRGTCVESRRWFAADKPEGPTPSEPAISEISALGGGGLIPKAVLIPRQ